MNNFDTLMDKMTDFVCPNADTIKEEKRFSSLSKLEKQLDMLRSGYEAGKYDGETLNDMVSQVLFMDGEDLSEEEYDRLYNKYTVEEKQMQTWPNCLACKYWYDGTDPKRGHGCGVPFAPRECWEAMDKAGGTGIIWEDERVLSAGKKEA